MKLIILSTTGEIKMREVNENLYNCPIMHMPMVIPITFANGKTYDLVSL